jgi:hypothetical protein
MRGPHDVGGLPAGPVDTTDHPMPLWERRNQAISTLLRNPQTGRPIGLPDSPLTGLDEARRQVESLGDDYFRLSYGERNVHALVQTLLRRGAISVEELARHMGEAST